MKIKWITLYVGICILFAGCTPVSQGVKQGLNTPVSPSATPAIAPEVEPMATQVEAQAIPISVAPILWVSNWSPDGQYLAYWEHPNPIVDYNHPPAGDLHFYSPPDGRECAYSGNYHQPAPWSRDAWLQGGKLLALTDDHRLLVSEPCSNSFTDLTGTIPEKVVGILAASRDRKQLLLAGETSDWILSYPEAQAIQVSELAQVEAGSAGYAWSPDGRVIAANVANGEEVTTYVIDSASGQASTLITWPLREGIGPMWAPNWLQTDQLLLGEVTGQGPLILNLEGETTSVIQVYFSPAGIEFDANQVYWAEANRAENQPHPHLVLTKYSKDGSTTYLFHPETNQVETFEKDQVVFFSADGSMLIIRQEITGEQIGIRVSVRGIDAAGQAPRPVWSGDVYSYNGSGWSPDSVSFAVHTPEGVSVISIRDRSEVASLNTGKYLAYPSQWSPDGSILAITGKTMDNQQNALYVMRFPAASKP